MKRHLLAWGVWLGMLSFPVAAETPARSWDSAFPHTAAPRNMYMRARYLDDKGVSHQLELWRQGNTHLRRRTDDRLDLFVDRLPNGEYRYRLADYERKMLIQVDRTNLYRIGVFSDWDGLAHVLLPPQGSYAIARLRRPSPSGLPGTCTWYALSYGKSGQGIAPPTSMVCWSRRWGIPLRIERNGMDHNTAQFSVQALSDSLPDSRVFEVPGSGLWEIDANQDINPSAD